MKRITLGALDYGLAFGVDRALRELVENGRLSALGALVATELWPREFRPLQETVEKVGKKAMFGVTLAFSGDRVAPVSTRMQEIYGGRMLSSGQIHRRAFLRLLPDELLLEEAQAQLARYSVLMKRQPDFVAVREGLLSRTSLARIVFKAIAHADYETPPLVVSPVNPGLTALRLARIAKSFGLEMLPKADPLPATSDAEELHRLLLNHFDGMSDRSFVAAIPGRPDERLNRDEPRKKVAIRECQYEVLASVRFFHTLEKKDVFLN
ncbi:ChbG/HpnK family deacetylase [Roseibium aggregatum]|uniref:ChbG/HpnK family deacetylase n=1 Tax=Roseibium aggregatum TaxID=187304 RepID=A0A939IYJ6_9HYPH|nr:ChbG/HpnK family deacetylase [Roseibium aggregatum]MBN9669041.1 ChbG/HpnK family deacetylase [Roseibium aggregatum]